MPFVTVFLKNLINYFRNIPINRRNIFIPIELAAKYCRRGRHKTDANNGGRMIKLTRLHDLALCDSNIKGMDFAMNFKGFLHFIMCSYGRELLGISELRGEGKSEAPRL